MVSVFDENEGTIAEDEKQFKEFMENEFFIHYVGMISPPRPGVHECTSMLEHKHYKPGTERNELFILRMMKWADFFWLIISIPIKEKMFMEEVANECGLRIANGVPTVFGPGGIEKFPVSNERVFTLENKAGHPVYRNDPAVNKAMQESENLDTDKAKKN